MSTALWPLQVAMYQRAIASPALMALVTGVFDEVPEDQVLPYVSLGSVTELEADAHNQLGLDVAAVWHIWSAYAGKYEAAQILDALDALFHRKSLVVEGWKDVSLANVQALTVKDPDPDIRHINVRYRAWLTKED